MRFDKKITISLGVSVGLHVLLLLFSTNIKLLGVDKSLNQKKRLFHVKTVKSKKYIKKNYHQSELGAKGTVKFQMPKGQARNKLLDKKAELLAKKFSPAQLQEKREFSDSSQSQRDLLKKIEKESKYLRKKEERQTRDQLVDVSMADSMNKTKNFIDEKEISADFIDRMPGFTPGDFAGNKEMLKTDGTYGQGFDKTALINETVTGEVVDQLFGGEVVTFEDPTDGQKYFQLKISAAESEELLPVVPKEIVFLIDCSISIEQDRLDQFKEGVLHSLNNLNTNDYFNVVAFKEKTSKFQEMPVKPTKENIEGAIEFIENLTAGQKTDTYNALYKSINLDGAVKPSYIFLLSDGRPTKGVTDTQRLINQISDKNDGKISIFAFSGGAWVNRYLLDFISYKNRGWAEYSSRSHLIGENLGKMYDKVRNPVLLNLRYYASGVDSKEIFPHSLPDLYQNVEFTLYGIYKDEESFVLQLNGSVDGEVKTFTMARSFKNAKKGDEEIARNWAFNKIYHLIGQLKEGKENKDIILQINKLSKKYKIKTPYQKRGW